MILLRSSPRSITHTPRPCVAFETRPTAFKISSFPLTKSGASCEYSSWSNGITSALPRSTPTTWQHQYPSRSSPREPSRPRARDSMKVSRFRGRFISAVYVGLGCNTPSVVGEQDFLPLNVNGHRKCQGFDH